MRPSRRSAFAIGLVCGAAIWLLSPVVTRHAEPWDAGGGYYPGALFITGFLAGLAVPAYPVSVALGVFAGQVLVLMGRVVTDPSGGGLWPLGVLFLGGYSVLTLVGAALGSALGIRVRGCGH